MICKNEHWSGRFICNRPESHKGNHAQLITWKDTVDYCKSCGTPIYKKNGKIIHVDEYMGDKCEIYNGNN